MKTYETQKIYKNIYFFKTKHFMYIKAEYIK